MDTVGVPNRRPASFARSVLAALALTTVSLTACHSPSGEADLTPSPAPTTTIVAAVKPAPAGATPSASPGSTLPAPATATATASARPTATTPAVQPGTGGALFAAQAPGSTNYPVPADAVFAAPTGRDDGAGTQADPVRTVTAALSKAPAGGTVVLRAGNYRETVSSVTRRVTIQPFPREQVWFNGADVVTDWSRDGAGWRSTDWRSQLCQSCYAAEAIDPARPLAGQPDQVFVNGTELTQVAGPGELAAGRFYVTGDGTVVIGTNPAGAQVEVSARWRAIQFNDTAAGSVLRGLGFRYYAPTWDEAQLATVIINGPDITVADNTLTRIAGTALAVTRPGAVVSGNHVTHNGYRGMVANRADNLVLKGNRFDTNNTAGFNTSGCGAYCTVAGAKITRSEGISITGNSFSANRGAGFWCDLGCISATVSGNTVADNSGNGLYYEVSTGAVIKDNAISRNGRGLKISGSDNVTISGNTFTANSIDLGVYDDSRDPASDPHSASQNLTWDTAQVRVTGNRFVIATDPNAMLLDTNRTSQVSAPEMFKAFSSNTFQPAEGGRVNWCEAKCTVFPTITRRRHDRGRPGGARSGRRPRGGHDPRHLDPRLVMLGGAEHPGDEGQDHGDDDQGHRQVGMAPRFRTPVLDDPVGHPLRQRGVRVASGPPVAGRAGRLVRAGIGCHWQDPGEMAAARPGATA